MQGRQNIEKKENIFFLTKKNVYKKKVSSFLTLFLAVDKVKVLSAVDVYIILANIDELNDFPGEWSQE